MSLTICCPHFLLPSQADKRDGHGVAKYVSGDKYEGGWRFGKREGKGRATYASGDGYEGEWKADKKQGVHGRGGELHTLFR